MTHLDDLLTKIVELGASDLLLKANCRPIGRKSGELIEVGSKTLDSVSVRDMSLSALTESQRDRFEQDLELDFSYEIAGYGRFRGNVYKQRGLTQSVFRSIPLSLRTLEELRLPPVCKYFAERTHGLILVTGSAGSGKSTTQAALIDYINRRSVVNIITVEDPVEFVHSNQQAIVNQREIHRDALSMPSALKSAMRQDPDVIMVGEMDDAESLGLALTAAEMGHLVFGTMHAADASQTIERYIDAFALNQQSLVRGQLAVNLVGIISQALVRTMESDERIAAYETLAGVPGILALIRDSKTSQIPAVLKSGMRQGMMTLDQSLANLVNKGLVSYDDALGEARNLTEFHFLCSGQNGDMDGALDRNTLPRNKATQQTTL